MWLATRFPSWKTSTVVVDPDMVIETGTTAPPLGKDVSFRRQGLKRRAVHLVEQLLPGGAEVAHDLGPVQPLEFLGDRRVQLGEREEAAVSQPCQEPPLDAQHAGFHLRLVARVWQVGPGEWPCRSERPCRRTSERRPARKDRPARSPP